MTNLTLGQKIRNFRNRANMTQLELELAIEAAQGSVSRIENDVINPTKETLRKIIDVFRLNARDAASLFDIDFGKELLKFVEIDGKLAQVGSTQTLFKTVMNELSNFLDIKYSSFWLYDERNHKLNVEAFHVPWLIVEIATKFITADLKSISFKIFKERHQNNDIVMSLLDGKVIVSKSAYEISRPMMKKSIAHTMQRILGMKQSIHIP